MDLKLVKKVLSCFKVLNLIQSFKKKKIKKKYFYGIINKIKMFFPQVLYLSISLAKNMR